MVNNAQYCAVLEEELKPTIYNKWSCFASWQHFTSYSSSSSSNCWNNLKTEIWVSPHPAYSPDHTPSDCHIFRPLKDALCGHWFANDE
jgi:hypothetical protein